MSRKKYLSDLTRHRKGLTVSEGNIVCQGCLCYLCISLGGLPVEASMGSHGRGMWVYYRHPGPLATTDRNRTGSKCTEGLILINTTCLHQTGQITLPAFPPISPHPKTSSHYLWTRLKSVHALSAIVRLLPEW